MPRKSKVSVIKNTDTSIVREALTDHIMDRVLPMGARAQMSEETHIMDRVLPMTVQFSEVQQQMGAGAGIQSLVTTKVQPLTKSPDNEIVLEPRQQRSEPRLRHYPRLDENREIMLAGDLPNVVPDEVGAGHRRGKLLLTPIQIQKPGVVLLKNVEAPVQDVHEARQQMLQHTDGSRPAKGVFQLKSRDIKAERQRNLSHKTAFACQSPVLVPRSSALSFLPETILNQGAGAAGPALAKTTSASTKRSSENAIRINELQNHPSQVEDKGKSKRKLSDRTVLFNLIADRQSKVVAIKILEDLESKYKTLLLERTLNGQRTQNHRSSKDVKTVTTRKY